MSSEGIRVALIVACNRYSDSKLKELQAPSQDAERFARILEDPKIGGFKVTTLIDQPHWIVAEKLNGFLKSCSKKDTLLLYFSCHGVKDEDGQLYFATVTTDRMLLYSTGIDSIFINRMLDRCQAQQKVVLLDCCYSGSFEKGSIAKADTQVNVAEFLGKGRVIITASDAMQYAFEGDDKKEFGIGGSYFTNGLIKGLESGEADKDGDGKITYSELYRYVYDYVKGITPNQTPTLSTRGVEGDFVVFKNIRDDLGSDKPESSPSKGSFEHTVKTQVNDPILGFVEEAKTFLENEQFDKAIKTFDGILMLRSGHIEALNGKGVALCKQKRYEEALECFKEVLKIKPRHSEASVYVDMITDRISKEHNVESEATPKEIERDTAALEKRTEEKVINALDKATQATPIPSDLIKKGNELSGKGMYQEALLYYDQALKIEPHSESTLFSKGYTLHNLRRYEEAIQCYDKALELKPNSADAWYYKGLALKDLGKYDEAIVCYDKAIEINSDYIYAWNDKGLALHNLRRYEEAIVCYDKAIEIRPQYYDFSINKGTTLFNMGKYDEAIVCYDKAIEINPNDPNAWYNKGNALDAKGDYEEALRCFEEALKIDPNSQIYAESIRVEREKLDRIHSPQNYDEHVRGADPRNPYSDPTLPYYKPSLDKKDESSQYIEKPAQRHHDTPATNDHSTILSPNDDDGYWVNKGNAFYDSGRYEEAIECYDKALEINPNYTGASYKKGLALDRLGKKKDAKKCYKKAKELERKG